MKGSEGWEVGGYLCAHNGTGVCNTILRSERWEGVRGGIGSVGWDWECGVRGGRRPVGSQWDRYVQYDLALLQWNPLNSRHP